MNVTTPHSAATTLRAVRARYGAAAEADKQRALATLALQPPRTRAALVRYHEDLLFIVAFPGALTTRRRALRELAGFGALWRALPRGARAAAANSGIAGTESRPSLAWPVAAWLVPLEARVLEWSGLDDEAALGALIALVSGPAARDAWDSGEFPARRWLGWLAGRTDEALRGLVRAAAAARTAGIAAAWDAAALPVRWQLGDSPRAATHARLPLRSPVLRTAMRRPIDAPVAHVMRPLEAIERLPRRDAGRVIALARAALAARAREVHAMNYPNPDEVLRCDLGEGVALMLIGTAPPQRLLLEANYGYVLLANGVPIGYGGVSPVYRQANTGINIFDAFRGAEAAYVWLQTLRAFRTLFSVRRFIINGYQFGAGNAEAIASGAYWFYYRLGFRPSLAANARLAAREAERLQRNAAGRSSAADLRRLARGDLHLDLDDMDPADHFDEPLLAAVGAAVARRVGELGETPQGGERRLVAEMARLLGVAATALRAPAVRAGFARLAPAAALLDVDAWPNDERRALAGWLLAKGAPQQLDFARGAHAQTRFFMGMQAIARQTMRSP
jgi:hypothetical protein